MKNMIGANIQSRRKVLGLTQEQLAERLGVSRQTVTKWETGETSPDLANAGALAEALDVSLDALVAYEARGMGLPMPPRGKHLFGTVTVGERGQIVIPKQARELFGITPGDALLVLGDEDQGLALMKSDDFMERIQAMRAHLDR
ncbi:helix-turn-helix domain-containing protein [Eggerthella sp. YY7918]|uniref:helix-turn-helix domain-containing protein n=1 Tax=Eggerthella sp. (strain YY7918) TaxID=502558 RepID=UPI001E3ABB66|nr:helix-turn-helix domain-containing protein [Eggerthella sp. YY7918]